jgi:hypothetical protein
MARLSRECIITEKIDGTNAQICITEDGKMLVGSRTRWITPESDNFGFARWAMEHRDELMTLGVGRHFGEWWGKGIQSGYGLDTKVFSLFNTKRWNELNVPQYCSVVPVLYEGTFDQTVIDLSLESLRINGSVAAPGFLNPEGIMVYHTASGTYFKYTLGGDGHKG